MSPEEEFHADNYWVQLWCLIEPSLVMSWVQTSSSGGMLN